MNELSKPRDPKSSAWAPAISLAVLGAFGVAGLSFNPVDPAEAAALFPPWWSESHVIAAADEAGDVVATARSPHVVIVRAQQGDIGDRLRSAGALLVFRPFGALSCRPAV
ncbi:MAG: hypothetical protein ACK41C_17560 [Phenylobacterium sp.]|uniref:hypothetical protein n=1 Tax=Phenylobacterium sp. TaxID=1871053 RepID=UPI00391D6D15